jgi:hypothetical protein
MHIFKLADTKREYSIDEKFSYIKNIRKFLLSNDIALEICKEFGYEIDIILGIPISFSDEIDVSAKTTNGEMFINSELISEGYDIMLRYVIHELVHAFQHAKNKSKGDPYPDEDYLDRPDEVEAFQFQIEFDDGIRGEDDAVEYVEELLEYHDVPGRERVDKTEQLMDKVD